MPRIRLEASNMGIEMSEKPFNVTEKRTAAKAPKEEPRKKVKLMAEQL